MLYIGGGVAGAPKRTGGEETEREALKHAPVSVWKAIATVAGKLQARWVVHTLTMEKPAMRNTAEKVHLATKATLECAEAVGAKNMMVLDIGTGTGMVPFENAALAMIETIKEFSRCAKPLRELLLCDLDHETVEAWRKELAR